MRFEELARDPFVVLRIGNMLCAISALHVKTMAEMPPVIRIPMAPTYLRGVVDLRGAIHSLADMRALLGYSSLAQERDEQLAMLQARTADHVRWLDELRMSVVESRTFTLQMDPHLCAFGQWYYSYVPPADWVARTLAKFEEPHNAIHALAAQVKGLQAEGRSDEALRRLDAAKSQELALLLELFKLLGEQIADAMREICLLLELDGRAAAFSVDAVDSIERFDATCFQNVEGTNTANGQLVRCFVRRRKDDAVISVLDSVALVTSVRGADAISPPLQNKTSEKNTNASL